MENNKEMPDILELLKKAIKNIKDFEDANYQKPYVTGVVVPAKIGNIFKQDMTVFSIYEPTTDVGMLQNGMRVVINSMLPSDIITLQMSDKTFKHIPIQYINEKEQEEAEENRKYLDSLPVNSNIKTILKN